MDHPTEIDPHAEARLLARAVAGDEASAGEVYDRFAPLAYAVSLRVLADPGLAEDCTQDVFISVWRNAERFDPERGRLGAWIATIARNRAIESLRRRRVGLVDVAAEPPAATPPQDDPSEVAARAEEAERVAALLAALPPAQQDVIHLAYFEGLTQTEIAARLDLPLGTVKGRIRLALDRLRAGQDVGR